MKIGVFICHCGSNIAGTVDCGKVAEIAKTYPDVAFSTDTMYTCSEPGQEEIVAAIKEHKLDGVVVASCTPRMHEPTFRRTVERAGLNKYMFEMANIREHVSWIGKDKEANTNKAAELVRIAVEKLRRDNPLFSKSFESTKRVLVIGGGVAGIQAALDCADAGLDVLLVERESHIGGKMAKLDKTFPTVDCSSCILGPKMVDVAQHPKITLMAASEVTNVSGYVGNFTVTVKKKATYVDWSKCTGCGACMDKCPAKKTPDKFNEFVGPTTAINIPFPQAIPKKATINAEFCRKLTSGKCGVCAKVCPTGAINYEMKDEEVTETVGAIVAATGYDLMDWTVYGEYGAGQYPDVITSLQYERIMSASGPTGGHIKRPSDGKEPKSVVFIQCVGSRDKSIGRPYCPASLHVHRQAGRPTKDHIPSCSPTCSTDITQREALHEFTPRRREYGTQAIRGRVSASSPTGTALHRPRRRHPASKPVEVKADMVVLARHQGSKARTARRNPAHLLRRLRVLHESHCKLTP
ncbi:MAG: 4Fe-4S binding protein [Bilophila wadsworthia]